MPLRELPERRDFELVAGLQDGQRRAGLPAAESAQIYAWEQELEILRHALARFSTAKVEQFPWTLALELAIPRRDRRLDALVLGPGHGSCPEKLMTLLTNEVIIRNQGVIRIFEEEIFQHELGI